jgi:thiol-disulfide isomerase/thioredoxin
MKKTLFFSLIGALLFSAQFIINDAHAQSSAGQPYKKMWAKSFLDQKAPDFVVEKWLSEEPSTKGKFILIDFWATWCGPCKKAIPELNHWHEKYSKQMIVIGLSDETEVKVTAMKSPVINYYSAIDTQKRLKSTFAVSGIPHIVLIDPKGIVRWEGFPFLQGYELTDQVLEDLFEKYGN